MQTDSELSEILMRAFILRRVELIAHGLGDVVLRRLECIRAGTLRIKEFLTRNGHPYAYLDLDADPEAQELLDRFQVAVDDVPVLICRGEDGAAKSDEPADRRLSGVQRADRSSPGPGLWS